MADPIQYEKIGLVNTKEMFIKAMDGGYAVPAYNFSNMEQLQAIVTGCAQSDSPVILQVSGSARRYADPVMIPHMVEGRGSHGEENGQQRSPWLCIWTMATVLSWPKTV
jgi:fructose-bisphosphate aldolase class II